MLNWLSLREREKEKRIFRIEVKASEKLLV